MDDTAHYARQIRNTIWWVLGLIVAAAIVIALVHGSNAAQRDDAKQMQRICDATPTIEACK